jgi:hypothetical protein
LGLFRLEIWRGEGAMRFVEFYLLI